MFTVCGGGGTVETRLVLNVASPALISAAVTVCVLSITLPSAFELLKQLLSTHNNHKQLPVSGKPNVATFLTIGVVLLQLAMLVNSIWGLPLRNVTHLITIFR